MATNPQRRALETLLAERSQLLAEIRQKIYWGGWQPTVNLERILKLCRLPGMLVIPLLTISDELDKLAKEVREKGKDWPVSSFRLDRNAKELEQASQTLIEIVAASK